MNKPQAPKGNLFVKADRRFIDTVKTESGIELFKDTTFHPEWNTCIEGVVHSIPIRVGSEPGCVGIIPTVKEGDKVFFEYHVLLDQRNSYIINGETYWLVSYANVFARKPKKAKGFGDLEPISGKALVLPEQETVNPEKVGLIYIPESARVKKQRRDRGILAYIGQPKKGEEPLGVKPGCRVFFPEFCAHENEISGTRYYVMNQEYILGYEQP